jgi:hypothetical protein
MLIFPNYVTWYSFLVQSSLKFDNYMREIIPFGVSLAYSMIEVFAGYCHHCFLVGKA